MKTYDVNLMDNPEEEMIYNAESVFTMDSGELPESVIEQFSAEGDEDACIIEQFENTLLDQLQQDEDMTILMSAYADARRRLTEKARHRGFWPVRGKMGSKGRSKGKSPVKGRRPLAQRIAESECRYCYKKGHWKNVLRD